MIKVRPIRCTRRALREVLELTPAGVNVAAASTALALEVVNEDYIDLAGLQQEGASILPAAWDALHTRHARATRLQDACDTLLNIAA